VIDRHTLYVAVRTGAALLAAVLLIHYWNGGPGVPANNFYLIAALLMCPGLVLLSDPLLDDPGLRAIAKLCGYAGLSGIAIATLL